MDLQKIDPLVKTAAILIVVGAAGALCPPLPFLAGMFLLKAKTSRMKWEAYLSQPPR